MDRTGRFYKIDTLLHNKQATPIDRLIGELQVSRATFKCDLEYMRDRLHAPFSGIALLVAINTPDYQERARRCQGCGLTPAKPMQC